MSDDIQDRIAYGLQYAVVPKTELESTLARCLYDELSNMWMGRGLSHQGGGGGDDGRFTVVVSGSIDLVALARRAINTLAG